MTNNDNPLIPAKRYFTLEEVCGLVQISPSEFAQWQHDHGTVVGYGGDKYTRSDVVKLLKLKSTFAPYTAGNEDSESLGEPPLTLQDVRSELEGLLDDLNHVLNG